MQPKIYRRVLHLLSVLLLVVVTTLVGTQGASANDNVPGPTRSSCAGSLVKHFPVKLSSKYGSVKIYVYYSKANGGTNCIIAKKSGAWAGKKTFMNLGLYRYDYRAAGAGYPYDVHDYGSYKYYAGAVWIPHTNGHCISAYLDLGSGSSAKTQFKYWSRSEFACG